MARLFLHGTSGAVACPAASTAKVIYQLITTANIRVAIQGWGVSFQGVSSTDSPILCRLTRSTLGTTGAVGTSSINKKNPDDAETVQTTCNATWGTPPAAGTTVEEFYVHPQTGYYKFYPQGQEIMIGGSAITYFAFEVTTGATITGTPNVTFEVDLEE